MANALYTKYKEARLGGDVAWDSDNIKCVLVDTADYVVNLATDQYLSDVTLAGRVATSVNFTTKSITDGIADADDITFSAVTGDVSEALVIYKDTGVEATSNLIAYIDTATGLPVTPNGGDITVQWDNGVNKIFNG